MTFFYEVKILKVPVVVQSLEKCFSHTCLQATGQILKLSLSKHGLGIYLMVNILILATHSLSGCHTRLALKSLEIMNPLRVFLRYIRLVIFNWCAARTVKIDNT